MPNKIDFELPLPPWSLEDSNPDEDGNVQPGLISRYGQEKGEEIYFTLARKLGYFDPKTEATHYRPALDCSPFLDAIREQHHKKSSDTRATRKTEPEGGAN